MPLRWDDLFFQEQAELVLDMYGLSEEDANAVQERWSEQMFEIDQIGYRNGVKYILDGRKSALAALQKLCHQVVLEKAGIRDRSRELAPRIRDNGTSNC